MTDFPAAGAYCIDDPHQPGKLSYWVLRGHGLEAWPTAASGKYGPPRPPRTMPGRTVEQRRDEMAWWRASVEEYRLEVLRRIAADPAAAAARWTRETERCSSCRRLHRAEDLPDTAAETAGEKLTAEQRQAIVADLRRAGHPEKLIAQLLGMSAKVVNRDARRAGIGAPLRPRRGTMDTGDVA